MVEYEHEVSQWENLWHTEDGHFRDLVTLSSTPERGRAWAEGARLMHIICKPQRPQRKIHGTKIRVLASQFWRSTWTRLAFFGRWMFGGHRRPPCCSSPVDFMAGRKMSFRRFMQVFLPSRRRWFIAQYDGIVHQTTCTIGSIGLHCSNQNGGQTC